MRPVVYLYTVSSFSCLDMRMCWMYIAATYACVLDFDKDIVRGVVERGNRSVLKLEFVLLLKHEGWVLTVLCCVSVFCHILDAQSGLAMVGYSCGAHWSSLRALRKQLTIPIMEAKMITNSLYRSKV
jgi:hypothetical protein